jgi:hypothetical protein
MQRRIADESGLRAMDPTIVPPEVTRGLSGVFVGRARRSRATRRRWRGYGPMGLARGPVYVQAKLKARLLTGPLIAERTAV